MNKHTVDAANASVSRNIVAVRAAMKIMDKWGCTPKQQQNILQLSKATFYRYRDERTKSASLSRDQLTRISYLLNMHSALRITFSNPENVYGFMSMRNNSAFFNGTSPLSLIERGDFGSLHEVAKRINAIRTYSLQN